MRSLENATLVNLADCLHILNKEAKRCRDALWEMEWLPEEENTEPFRIEFEEYDEYFNGLIPNQSEEEDNWKKDYLLRKKEVIYDLKEAVLSIIKHDLGVRPIGAHRFPDGYYREYFEFGGWGFHGPRKQKEALPVTMEFLGDIAGEIPSCEILGRIRPNIDQVSAAETLLRFAEQYCPHVDKRYARWKWGILTVSVEFGEEA